MFNPNIISETPISMAETRKQLQEIAKRDKELGFRAARTEEYFKMFVSLSHEKAAELEKKLEKLDIPRLKDVHIKKIVDLTPSTVNDVKLILQGYSISVAQASMKKIADTVAEFLPKKK